MTFLNDGPWLMVLFPVLHLAAGVYITYSTIAGFFNRTEITLDGGLLSVWHGPIPWLGNMSTSAAGALSNCTAWRRRSGTIAVTINVRWSSSMRCLASGKSIPIVRSLPREEGLFIEQQLEEWLEITPRRVPGQVD